jgi:AraC family transcriptional regulator, regulatory protein of adaptative response / methylated-DNA-[protein]-cysteine methyltransferase
MTSCCDHNGLVLAMESAVSDYHRIARAIAFLVVEGDRQPSLQQVADHLQLDVSQARRLFNQWVGVGQAHLLQVLTVARARALLACSPEQEVADKAGLGSALRRYDHCVQVEPMTPQELARGGAGLHIAWGIHDSPFGAVLLAATRRGICRLEFVDDADVLAAPDQLADVLQQYWPGAHIAHAPERTVPLLAPLLTPSAGGMWGDVGKPLPLHVAGTDFQIGVWRALLRLPAGQLTTYSRLARACGRPGGARAVGQAVGANPVALLIPCHRVIRESGALGGYRWGVLRKQAIYAHETARLDDNGGQADASAGRIGYIA